MITETSELPVRGKTRHYAAIAVFVFLSIVLLVAWHRYSSFRWDLFTEALRNLDWRWLTAGAALALLSYFGRAARWKVMMLPTRSRLGSIFAATLIGFSAVVVFGRAGEVVRPILISREDRSTLAGQAAVWVLERLFDLLLILLLFGVGLAESESFRVPSGSILLPVLRIGGGVVIVAAGAACAILYLLARHPATCGDQLLKVLSFLPSAIFKRVERTLGSFLRGAECISRPGIMLSSLLLTAVEWAIVLAAVWCYFQAHPALRGLGLLDVAMYVGFVSIGSIVQLPGIGGGVQIVSVVVLTELFHTPVEVATGLSLLIWAGLALIVLPLGIPLALIRHLKVSEFRQELSIDAETRP
ncbi:MAG: lysylphosphatidylglycerol synthase transmembrane domain-containing protein [Bryobacteraceae bacterium]